MLLNQISYFLYFACKNFLNENQTMVVNELQWADICAIGKQSNILRDTASDRPILIYSLIHAGKLIKPPPLVKKQTSLA